MPILLQSTGNRSVLPSIAKPQNKTEITRRKRDVGKLPIIPISGTSDTSNSSSKSKIVYNRRTAANYHHHKKLIKRQYQILEKMVRQHQRDEMTRQIEMSACNSTAQQTVLRIRFESERQSEKSEIRRLLKHLKRAKSQLIDKTAYIDSAVKETSIKKKINIEKKTKKNRAKSKLLVENISNRDADDVSTEAAIAAMEMSVRRLAIERASVDGSISGDKDKFLDKMLEDYLKEYNDAIPSRLNVLYLFIKKRTPDIKISFKDIEETITRYSSKQENATRAHQFKYPRIVKQNKIESSLKKSSHKTIEQKESINKMKYKVTQARKEKYSSSDETDDGGYYDDFAVSTRKEDSDDWNRTTGGITHQNRNSLGTKFGTDLNSNLPSVAPLNRNIEQSRHKNRGRNNDSARNAKITLAKNTKRGVAQRGKQNRKQRQSRDLRRVKRRERKTQQYMSNPYGTKKKKKYQSFNMKKTIRSQFRAQINEMWFRIPKAQRILWNNNWRREKKMIRVYHTAAYAISKARANAANMTEDDKEEMIRRIDNLLIEAESGSIKPDNLNENDAKVKIDDVWSGETNEGTKTAFEDQDINTKQESISQEDFIERETLIKLEKLKDAFESEALTEEQFFQFKESVVEASEKAKATLAANLEARKLELEMAEKVRIAELEMAEDIKKTKVKLNKLRQAHKVGALTRSQYNDLKNGIETNTGIHLMSDSEANIDSNRQSHYVSPKASNISQVDGSNQSSDKNAPPPDTSTIDQGESHLSNTKSPTNAISKEETLKLQKLEMLKINERAKQHLSRLRKFVFRKQIRPGTLFRYMQSSFSAVSIHISFIGFLRGLERIAFRNLSKNDATHVFRLISKGRAQFSIRDLLRALAARDGEEGYDRKELEKTTKWEQKYSMSSADIAREKKQAVLDTMRLKIELKRLKIRIEVFFEQMDKNMSGNISFMEFVRGMESVNISLSRRAARQVFKILSPDGVCTLQNLSVGLKMPIGKDVFQGSRKVKLFSAAKPVKSKDQLITEANTIFHDIRKHLIRKAIRLESFFELLDVHGKGFVTFTGFSTSLDQLNFVRKKRSNLIDIELFKLFGANESGILKIPAFSGALKLPETYKDESSLRSNISQFSFTSNIEVNEEISEAKQNLEDLLLMLQKKKMRLETFFYECDVDHSGSINVMEFLKGMNSYAEMYLNKRKAMTMFKLISPKTSFSREELLKYYGNKYSVEIHDVNAHDSDYSSDYSDQPQEDPQAF